MIGKIIGATVGRKAANAIGTKVGGPVGAAIGYGLVSRRFRGAAIGGLAVMGGLALLRRFKGEQVKAGRPFMKDAEPAIAVGDTVTTNGDPLPAYAPR